MPQISYIKYTDVLEARRYDAEYFKPEYLAINRQLQSKDFVYFEDFSFITDGIHSSIDFDETSNILLFSAKAPKENVFDISGLSYISYKQHKQNPRTALQENDVIISTVGTIGNCAVMTSDFLPANSDRHVGIIRPKNISSFFVSTFLLSKYGRMQSSRNVVGNVQPNLYIRDMKKFILPIFPQSFQLQIEQIVKSAHQKQIDSKQLYREAEELLLSELGLVDYQVKHSLWFTTTKNEVSVAHRYDSEYFQPKYAEIIKKIEEYEGGYFTLSDKNYSKISRGSLIPDSFYNLEKGNPYIRGADFSSGILGNDKLVFINDSFQKTRETMVRENDIIFSLIGSVGATALVSKDFDNSFISNNTGKISIKNFDSTVLQIILQSIVGKLQFEKEKTQTAQPKISSDQVGNFKIPLIKPSIQKQIADKVQESHRLRKESKELLEEAKRKVEEEIEKPQ